MQKNIKLNYSHKLKVKNHEVRESDVTGEVMRKRKSILILSDSMLNQIDETRLCKYGEVKVRCHEGCTVDCMYSHLPALLCDKPDYVVLPTIVYRKHRTKFYSKSLI